MTEVVLVVQQNPTHLPSSPSTSSTNDNSHQQQEHDFINNNPSESDGLSLLAVLVAGFRKSLVVGCSERKRRERRKREEQEEEFCCWGVDLDMDMDMDMDMDIGRPTNVRHVAHVTFDRFNGFLGLPVEFEPLVPRRAPSASAKVFGVSTESMQLSFDSRGNSVPTILLLMQRCLYAQGGLQAEGIFRINAENTQEENVRDQLNRGVVPEGIDVHCLAGLIKAWFRELPTGILDSLSQEQVMESQSEEEYARLVTLLPPTEAALLDWAVNLMADVAQLEHLNKMNARNIAMVFAPNMTQMADPLTALVYAVKVMNFLKTLIVKTLKAREDSLVDTAPIPHVEPSDENGPHSSSQPFVEETHERNEQDEALVAKEPIQDDDTTSKTKAPSFLTSIENIIIPGGNGSSVDDTARNGFEESGCNGQIGRKKTGGRLSNLNLKKVPRKATVQVHNNRGNGGIVSRLSSRIERTEAWR